MGNDFIFSTVLYGMGNAIHYSIQWIGWVEVLVLCGKNLVAIIVTLHPREDGGLRRPSGGWRVTETVGRMEGYD